MTERATGSFSPFISTLELDVVERLGALLGIPPTVAFRWDVAGDAIRIRLPSVEGTDDDLVAELSGDPRCPVRHPDRSDVGLSFQRTATGSDPWSDPELAPFARAIASAFRRSDGAAIDRVHAAIADRRRFAGLDDWMFRQVNASNDDLHGNLRLGFRCNQDCGFCWQGRSWPEPDAGYYLKWLDEMAVMGIRALSITGGEPTLHPALPELLQKAGDAGLEVTVQTNAVQLAKERVRKQLVAAGLHQLFVSLHSMDAAVSDAMTRAPGTWERTVAGIDACLRDGLHVELNCVVERANFAQLAALANEVVERFVVGRDNPVRAVTFSHPCSYYDSAVYAQQTARLADVRPHLLAAVDVLSSASVVVRALGTCGFVPCVLGSDASIVEEQLALSPPAHTADRTDTAGRVYGPVCDGCDVRERCLGVRREYVDLHGFNGLQAIENASA